MVTGPQVNTVLQTTMRLSDSGDEQLTILLFALVIGMKSMGIERETLHELIVDAWNTPVQMVRGDKMKTIDLKKAAN